MKDNSPGQSESASAARGYACKNPHHFPAQPGERSEYIRFRVLGFRSTIGLKAIRTFEVTMLVRMKSKRTAVLVFLRLLLATGIVYALPEAHMRWGEPYSGDGQQAFGFIVIFFAIGMAAAAVFLVVGTIGQFLLRKRPARFTVFTDLVWFLIFSGLLIYTGVTVKYQNSQPDNSVRPTANGKPFVKNLQQV